MGMSVYQQVFEIAQAQAAAAAAGDLNMAVSLLERRGELIRTTPAATPADEPLIRATLDLDRDIATAIRHRMLAIREDLIRVGTGKAALAGYAGKRGQGARVFDLGA